MSETNNSVYLHRDHHDSFGSQMDSYADLKYQRNHT